MSTQTSPRVRIRAYPACAATEPLTAGEIAAILARPAPAPLQPRLRVETVGQLATAYLRWAASYYVKRGAPTATVAVAARAIAYLRLARLTAFAPTEFGPMRLAAFQGYLCGLVTAENPRRPQRQRLTRTTMNEYVRSIVAMFKWGASREAYPESVWLALRTVKPLARHRAPDVGVPPPREGRKRRPPPPGAVEAALPYMPTPVRSMVELEALSACRPGEICAMRAGDLRPTADPQVLAYDVRPESNKVDHHEIVRTVYLGPKAVALLTPWLAGLEPEDYVFSPRRVEYLRNAARRAARTTPLWPSHTTAVRRRRRGQRPARWGECYTVDSYRRAVERSCDYAGVPRWTPGQLRHSGASHFANREDLLTARAILGHTDVRTTMNYVVADDAKVLAAVRREG